MRIAFSAVTIFLILILTGEFFYLRNFLSRFFAFWRINGSKKSIIIIKYIIIAVLIMLSAFVFSLAGIATLHIIGAVAAVDFVSFIVMKISKKKLRFLNAFAVSAIPAVIIGTSFVLYGIFNMNNIVKTEYDIQTAKNLTQQYKIALVSDMHFGNSIDMNKLHNIVEEINTQNADMLILAGDITDDKTDRDSFDEIFETVAKTKTKYGIYYVFGNHDKAPAELIESKGIHVLGDETELINDELLLVGHKDAAFKNKSERKSVYELLKNEDKNRYVILADHQPAQFGDNKKAGVDLQVSGHTHAGQIFPGGLLTATIGGNDYNYGLYKDDSFCAIVSSGISGWGFDFRTEKHSEYVIINLSHKS